MGKVDDGTLISVLSGPRNVGKSRFVDVTLIGSQDEGVSGFLEEEVEEEECARKLSPFSIQVKSNKLFDEQRKT